MSLAESFNKAHKEPAVTEVKCVVCKVVKTLSSEDAKIVTRELSRPMTDPRYLTGRQIANVLEQNKLGDFRPDHINRCRKAHYNGTK